MPTLSASQFMDWRIYNRLEPFGIDVTHRLMCNALATYINANLGSGHAPVHPDDLMLRIDTAELWQEIEAQMTEQRRLDRMTQEERNAEAVAQFIAAHSTRPAKPLPGDDIEEG